MPCTPTATARPARPRSWAYTGSPGTDGAGKPCRRRTCPSSRCSAPDLIGHGRSSWAAPWTVEANVAALAAPAGRRGRRTGPGGQAFVRWRGGAQPRRGPARSGFRAGAAGSGGRTGRRLDGRDRRRDARLPDYPDREEATADKLSGSWGEVAAKFPDELTREARRAP